MRAAAALLLVAGCGRFNFGDAPRGDASSTTLDGRDDATSDGPDAAIVPPPDCMPTETRLALSSTFDTLPPWASVYGASEVNIVNGTLVITPQPNNGAVAYWGFVNPTPTDHRDQRMFIEVQQMIDPVLSSQAVFRFSGTDEWTQFYVMDGVIYFELQLAGVPVNTYTTYDPVAHRWWQLRETAGVVYFETAPDGVTWTVRGSYATPAFLATSQIEIAAGYYEVQTGPLGMLRLDNLTLCD